MLCCMMQPIAHYVGGVCDKTHLDWTDITSGRRVNTCITNLAIDTMGLLNADLSEHFLKILLTSKEFGVEDNGEPNNIFPLSEVL